MAPEDVTEPEESQPILEVDAPLMLPTAITVM